MNDLEVAACVNDHGSDLTDVTGTRIRRIVFDYRVADLEQFLRYFLICVLLETLEQARQE